MDKSISISCYVYPGLSVDWKRNQDKVIDAVCSFYKLTRTMLMDKCRHRNIVEPRYVAMWLLRKNTTYTLSEIGLIFRKDHATVLYACKQVENWREFDSDFNERTKGFLS